MRVFRSSLEMRRRLGVDIGGALNNVGYGLWRLGRSAEALPIQQEGLELKRQNHPSDHGSIASSLNSLADSLHALGRFAEALPLWEEALEMQRRLPSPSADRWLAIYTNQVGRCLKLLGRPTEAMAWHEEALRIERQLFPDGHYAIAWTLS